MYKLFGLLIDAADGAKAQVSFSCALLQEVFDDCGSAQAFTKLWSNSKIVEL